MTAQPSSQAEREDVALRTALVEYAMHYGPRCRECANHDDICPISGMACGERRKATEFVVDALIYGAAHGHCPSSLSQSRELDDCQMALGGFDPNRKSQYWALYTRPDREHAPEIALTHPEVYDLANATPRSMPEEVVEAYERAAKVARDVASRWQAHSRKRCPVTLGAEQFDSHECDLVARCASSIAGEIERLCATALIPGASA